jgi:hypothetical protein
MIGRKTRVLKITICLVLLSLALGCTKERVLTSDEAAIKKLIEEDTTGWFYSLEWLNDSLIEDSIPLLMARTYEGDTFPFIRGWGREILSRAGDIHIEIYGDTAYATFDFDLEGVLHVAGPDTTIEKSLLDHMHREVRFVRNGDPHRHHGWMMDAFTLAEISTVNGTLEIDSIRVVGGDVDYTFTDPGALIDGDSVLTFPPETEVDLYLYVANPMETLAFLHHWGRHRHHHRSGKFYYDPETGALKGTWTTPSMPGVYHVGVDAMTWSTLFVISSPYDSESWVTSYLVTP